MTPSDELRAKAARCRMVASRYTEAERAPFETLAGQLEAQANAVPAAGPAASPGAAEAGSAP